jgi:hypothetical protein
LVQFHPRHPSRSPSLDAVGRAGDDLRLPGADLLSPESFPDRPPAPGVRA